MERMSTLDAGFFFVEHRNVPMHLGSLMVFEGPAPAYSGRLRVGGKRSLVLRPVKKQRSEERRVGKEC